MSRQLYVTNSIYGRRGFSSASDLSGLNRCRRSVPPASLHGARSRIGGYSTRSLSNIGGNRQIYCSQGYQVGGNGSIGLGHHSIYGGQSYGEMYHGVPRSHVELRNYAGSCKNDHIHGVSFKEHLLKALCIGVDPEIQTIRMKEREEMKTLNDQFARFIDQVRCLEQTNKVLVTKWNLLQEHTPPVWRDLKFLFENFVCSLRKHLDFLLSEKEQMEPQLRNIKQSVGELKCKYAEEINQRTGAENDFVLLKKDVDHAFMNKMELEAKVATVKREIDFLRCVHGEEITLLEEQIQHQTAILVEMDNSRDLDMNCILQNVEAWYQNIAQKSKEEVNTLYRSRYQELHNQKCQMSDHLKISKHEIAELSRLVQRFQAEMEKNKKQVACLQSAICDTEQRGDCSLKEAQEKHSGLYSTLQKSKDELAFMLQSYQALLSDKLALDIEITTYKSLLEGEENRIFAANLGNVGVFPNPSKGADCYGPEPGYGSLSGGYKSGRSGKYSFGGPRKGKNPRDADGYAVGYPSRNISKTGSKQHTPGGGNFNSNVIYHSPGGGAHQSRGASCGMGECATSIVGRHVETHSNANNSVGPCCPGHSCHQRMKMSAAPSFFPTSSRL